MATTAKEIIDSCEGLLAWVALYEGDVGHDAFAESCTRILTRTLALLSVPYVRTFAQLRGYAALDVALALLRPVAPRAREMASFVTASAWDHRRLPGADVLNHRDEDETD